jgi:hypothetical protein
MQLMQAEEVAPAGLAGTMRKRSQKNICTKILVVWIGHSERTGAENEGKGELVCLRNFSPTKKVCEEAVFTHINLHPKTRAQKKHSNQVVQKSMVRLENETTKQTLLSEEKERKQERGEDEVEPHESWLDYNL